MPEEWGRSGAFQVARLWKSCGKGLNVMGMSKHKMLCFRISAQRLLRRGVCLIAARQKWHKLLFLLTWLKNNRA